MARIKKIACLFVWLIIINQHISAQNKTNSFLKDSLSLAQNVDSFVYSFSNLNWTKFTSFFDDNATAFFPSSAGFTGRATGKNEIEHVFAPFFEKVKKQQPVNPHLDILPLLKNIQIVDSIGIVTFLLKDSALLGRRTLVFVHKKDDTWRIIHLHASGVQYSGSI